MPTLDSPLHKTPAAGCLRVKQLICVAQSSCILGILSFLITLFTLSSRISQKSCASSLFTSVCDILPKFQDLLPATPRHWPMRIPSQLGPRDYAEPYEFRAHRCKGHTLRTLGRTHSHHTRHPTTIPQSAFTVTSLHSRQASRRARECLEAHCTYLVTGRLVMYIRTWSFSQKDSFIPALFVCL
jgi:hypothetical protein